MPTVRLQLTVDKEVPVVPAAPECPRVQALFQQCLELDSTKRPSASALLQVSHQKKGWEDRVRVSLDCTAGTCQKVCHCLRAYVIDAHVVLKDACKTAGMQAGWSEAHAHQAACSCCGCTCSKLARPMLAANCENTVL